MPSQAVQAVKSMDPSVLSWLDAIKPQTAPKHRRYPRLPPITEARRIESLADAPVDGLTFGLQIAQGEAQKKETVLYLAYGSNLSVETFRGARGIKPLSQVNVLVPQLRMTFDLPGVPYSEPCFANSAYRDPHEVTGSAASEETTTQVTQTTDYHKDRWHKGLVGEVYEVTKADFAHIIETEGGGASYQDVLVDCYALTGDPRDEVPANPTGQTFKAHTLFAPQRSLRPDPAYAQPSARYLKLITDGARECALPYEYETYLHEIRPYEMTTAKQRLGQFIFIGIWSPLFLLIFQGGKVFLGADGRYPAWFATFTSAIFAAVWASYDGFFKGLFGDGERTTKEREKGSDDEEALLEKSKHSNYGTR